MIEALPILFSFHPESTRGGRVGTFANPVIICHLQSHGSDKNGRFERFPLKDILALKPYQGLRESPDLTLTGFFQEFPDKNYLGNLRAKTGYPSVKVGSLAGKGVAEGSSCDHLKELPLPCCHPIFLLHAFMHTRRTPDANLSTPHT